MQFKRLRSWDLLTKVLSNKNLEKKIKKHIASPFYKHHTVLVGEDVEKSIHEFVMDQRKVNDDKLVHVGVTILQESKLLFLKFVEFLRNPSTAGESTIHSYSHVFRKCLLKRKKTVVFRLLSSRI